MERNPNCLWCKILLPKAIARGIIEIELNLMLMSTVSCTSCVVVISQQQEQNICHQQQSQDEPVIHSQTTGKNCTVVKNGRVVVVPASSQPQETNESKNT
ncbi:hypothetical protein LC593_29230 [Nostoc sp. CHAB 5844]|nr:hypothetical protein [Nostoc sp. CHAB 5844]